MKLPTRTRRLVLYAAVPLIIAAPPILYMGHLLLADDVAEYYNRRPFDSAVWKDSLLRQDDNPIRLRMIDSLLAQHRLVGLPRAQVVELLGIPPTTEYFRDDDLVYWLGPERGFLSIDSEWLAIRFDRSDQVSDAKVLRD